ncbi:MAG: hypothetical protein J3Q66DRAFT_34685 [Benniella sp.]|nr:MAG: hypothetical protein J3Q66DRAFT_34685 [Benniella sp.]
MERQSEQDGQHDSRGDQDTRSDTNHTTTDTGAPDSNNNPSETTSPGQQSVPEPTRRPQPAGDHWCHECQRDITPLMVPHPMCPHCHGEFVEKIEADNDPRAFAQPAARDDGQQGGPGPHEPLTLEGLFQQIQMLMGSQGMYQPPTSQQQQPQSQQQQRPQQQRWPGQTSPGTAQVFVSTGPLGMTMATTISGSTSHTTGAPQRPFGGSFSSGFSTGTSSSSPQAAPRGEGDAAWAAGSMGGGQQPSPLNPLAGIFNRLFELQYGTETTPLPGGFLGGPLLGGSFFPMFGNPGDYVTQGGLDNFITQMMELHSRQNGPVAATDEIIDRIPHHKFTEEELAAKPECSVCKDEFTQEDDTLQLPCNHFFHGDCIKPWLKVSGTCPTCRFSLVEGNESTEQSGENSSASASTGAETNTSNAQSAQSQSSRGIGGMRPGFLSMSIPGAFPSNVGNSAGNSSSSSSNNRGSNSNNPDTDTDMELD